MFKKILIASFLIFLLYALCTLSVSYHKIYLERKEAEEKNTLIIKEQERIDKMSVPELIEYIAPQYGADPKLINKITMCESSQSITADHDGGHGKGVAGYWKSTFEGDKKEFKRPELRYESTFDQLVMMSTAFSKSEAHRNRWTTYRAYKNGGTYAFHSTSMNRDYVVHCS